MSRDGQPAPTRGPGRPPVGPAIEVRLPPEVLAWLDAEAQREGTTRADLVRGILLRQWVREAQ